MWDEDVLKLIVVMAAQPCDWIKNHGITNTLHELYPDLKNKSTRGTNSLVQEPLTVLKHHGNSGKRTSKLELIIIQVS